MKPITWTKEQYQLSTDRAKLDVTMIHRYLSEDSYWAPNIPRDIVELSIEHSLCFGLYHQNEQVGFARMITDYATFGYLADVFILPSHQGQGLGKWMMWCIKAHPELQRLRWMMLATADAHGLYQQYGFQGIARPDRLMEARNFTNYTEVLADRPQARIN